MHNTYEQNIAKQLLKPLGLEIAWNSDGPPGQIVTTTFKQLVSMTSNNKYTFGLVRSYAEFLDMLLNYIVTFNTEPYGEFYANNPYFGCRSYEEALIKSDLI